MHTIIGENNQGNLNVYHDLDSLSIKNSSFIKNYKVGKKVNEIQFENQIYNNYIFKNQTFLVVDSIGIFQIGNKSKPIVLLIQSPKINLERLIKELKPLQIIADASNYKNRVVNWKYICDKKGIPFHYTAEKGAIVFK
mgnify:CR=1 FL=1